MKINSNPKQKRTLEPIKTSTNKKNAAKRKKSDKNNAVTIIRLNSSRCFLTREGKKIISIQYMVQNFFCVWRPDFWFFDKIVKYNRLLMIRYIKSWPRVQKFLKK